MLIQTYILYEHTDRDERELYRNTCCTWSDSKSGRGKAKSGGGEE
jgi:hypothetical protein